MMKLFRRDRQHVDMEELFETTVSIPEIDVSTRCNHGCMCFIVSTGAIWHFDFDAPSRHRMKAHRASFHMCEDETMEYCVHECFPVPTGYDDDA